jgi:hypothetical protein
MSGRAAATPAAATPAAAAGNDVRDPCPAAEVPAPPPAPLTFPAPYTANGNAGGAPRTPATPDAVDRDGRDGTESAHITAMRQQLADLRVQARLQRDPAWVDVLSRWEERRERAGAQGIRRLQRRHQRAAATSTARLAGRERRAAARLAAVAVADRIWQARALARRTRLLDPTSRLAAIQRVHTVTASLLLALIGAGIVWTSVGVHDALVGPAGPALAYIVEPLFSLPLVVIMRVHAVAAAWGRRFPTPEHRRQIYALEAGLLGATVLLNVSPVAPVLGRWVDTTTLLAHLAPPALILVAVVLAPMVAAFLSAILADAHLDAAGDHQADTGRRLDAETVDTLTLVAKVQTAIAAGELGVPDCTGRPSTEAIRRFFGCEKRRAQRVADALDLLAPALGAGPAGGSA